MATYPAYVPAAVRAYITKQLDEDQGWAASFRDAEERLSGIDRAIEKYLQRGEDGYMPSLRLQRADALKHRDMLAGEVDCLQRLAHDARMADAFALLTREFSDDQQWREFVSAAWAARADFAMYRDRLKRATELKGKIADASETLVKLIRQFSEIGISGPSEFYSVPELLRQTDNHEMQDHNLHMWRSMRKHVLGDSPTREIKERKPAGESSEPIPEIRRVIVPLEEKLKTDPEEETRNVLRYGWDTAPEFSALLDTVANAARAFKPSESGAIGKAIESRQKSPKTEYLRAFGSLLADHGFTLTAPVTKAVAIVANVVINLHDVDVTYDDVRKSLKQGDKRLENSSDK